MFRWFYVLLHLLREAGTARRDARVRFLKAEVDILRRKLGGNRVILGPDDRARLIAIGAELNHQVRDLIGIVTPRTYSRWLLEQREGRKPGRVGRPKIARNLCELVKRLARENAGWGYRRILGELRKLRLRIGRSSVREILKKSGLTPSPHRRGRAEETVWRTFIRLHVNTLVACDFFTKSVITPLGTRIAYSLVFIHVGTRRVFVSPPTYEPHAGWVQQQGRNVLMWLGEQKLDAKYIVHDRDTKFSVAFDRLFFAAGVRRIRTPRLAPDANAYAEAWIGSLKRECLNHFLCFGLPHLDHILQFFARFYNEQRPHQGIGNRTIPQAAADAMPAEESAALPTTVRSASLDAEVGRVRCTRLLGGLLRHYERDAA